MARKQCQVCGQPATVRVEANLNGRHSTMLLCDDHYRQLVRQQKAHRLTAGSVVRLRSGLFEDFLGSDSSASVTTPSMAADTDEVVDACSANPPWPVHGGAPSRQWAASRISEQSEALLQEAARHAAELARRSRYRTPAAGAIDSDVVKTILGQFKINVDDLKRQIESEAKRGDKPFEGEIGVSPGSGRAQPCFSWPPTNSGHSYVGRDIS